MNRIAGVITMHLKSGYVWFLVPWMILLGSFAINLLLALIVKGKATIYTGGLGSIYIYVLILGSLTVRDTFSFALGFSVRRIDYFLGTVAFIVAFSALTAIALLLLSFIENNLTGGWGLQLHFFHLPYVNDGPLIGQLWIYFAVMIHMYFLGFVPASAYQRFGRIGLGAFFAVAFVGGLICTYFTLWGGIFHGLIQQTAVELASWMALVMVGYALISYLLLRKATL